MTANDSSIPIRCPYCKELHSPMDLGQTDFMADLVVKGTVITEILIVCPACRTFVDALPEGKP